MRTQIALVEPDADWQNHQCNRVGAPPLRFRGRLLDWQEAGRSDANLFLGLFQRKSGGFTLALCRLTDCGVWVPHAVIAPTLEAVVVAVEQYCCDLLDEVAQSRPAFPGPAARLCDDMARHGRIAAEVRQFQLLAGRALENWSRLT